MEIDISRDSLKVQLVAADLNLKGFELASFKHSGIYPLTERIVIVIPVKNPNEATRYNLLTIFQIKSKVSFELAVNGIRTITDTIEELVQLSTYDTSTLSGNIFFHKEYFSELKNLRNVDNMTVDDFKRFLKKLIATRLVN